MTSMHQVTHCSANFVNTMSIGNESVRRKYTCGLKPVWKNRKSQRRQKNLNVEEKIKVD